MALRRQALDYGDEASQYGFESFKEYKKGTRGGLRGAASGAAKGAQIGAGVGTALGTAVPGVGNLVGLVSGTTLGAAYGAGAGFLSGNRKMKKEYLKYAKDMTEKALEEQRLNSPEEIARRADMAAREQARQEDLARQRALYGTTTTQPIVGGELPMFKEGGVAKMVMINVEKGELAIDPRTMKVIMDFNNVPKHPKGKDVINQKGNVKVPVGTIIIPADKRKEFLAAKPAQRIEIAGEIIESQREKEQGEEMEIEEQMPMQGQGMMAMMGGEEEDDDEMERMEYGGYVGDDKETYRGFRKANKQSEDVYKQWEKQTLEAHPNAKKEALRPFYEKHVTPILGNKNEVGFIENSIYDMGIHGTDEKNPRVFPNKIKITDEMIKNLKEKGKNSKDTIPTKGGLNYEMMLQNIMNKDVDYKKFSDGGYVKKYQNAGIVTGAYPTTGTAVGLTGGSAFGTGTLGGYNPLPYTAPAVDQYEMTTNVDSGYQPVNIYQTPQAKPQTPKSAAKTTGGSTADITGGLATGIGLVGAGATQIFGGKQQKEEATRALQELSKQSWAKYAPTAELEQQGRDTLAARERAKYGFSAAELATRQQMGQQVSNTAYQRARESGMGGQLAGALRAASDSQRLRALNELAIADERAKREKAREADAAQRSLAQQYQQLADRNVAFEQRLREQKERAYGEAYKVGQENIYGGASTLAAGGGYMAGAGLTSLLSLL
jgi:hypothetical protein